MGIAADPNEVVTSALATAELLARRGGGRVFVIGEDGVREALAGAGLEILQGEPETADLVVVGFDGGATYAKLKTAGLLVQRGAKLVATNATGRTRPPTVCGRVRAPCSRSSPRRPAQSRRCSKAVRPLFEAGLRRGGGGRPLVVGDRLETDIEGPRGSAGTRCWCSRGFLGRADVEATGARPTVIAEDVSALLEDP